MARGEKPHWRKYGIFSWVGGGGVAGVDSDGDAPCGPRLALAVQKGLATLACLVTDGHIVRGAGGTADLRGAVVAVLRHPRGAAAALQPKRAAEAAVCPPACRAVCCRRVVAPPCTALCAIKTVRVAVTPHTLGCGFALRSELSARPRQRTGVVAALRRCGVHSAAVALPNTLLQAPHVEAAVLLPHTAQRRPRAHVTASGHTGEGVLLVEAHCPPLEIRTAVLVEGAPVSCPVDARQAVLDCGIHALRPTAYQPDWAWLGAVALPPQRPQQQHRNSQGQQHVHGDELQYLGLGERRVCPSHTHTHTLSLHVSYLPLSHTHSILSPAL
eukprot:Sspe_Gene.62085::Locus_34651_Transcript_1_1_Confidence_1.000_Length_1088::g.62085::m.62085